MSKPRLLADIGGTNARFALARDADSLTPEILPVRRFGRFEEALESFLEVRGIDIAEVGSCAVAAAGPVVRGVVRLTNAPWTIDTRALSARLDCPVGVLNDLEAVACALPVLGDGDLAVLRAGSPPERAPMIALNVGTGFGAAVALHSAGAWHPLATEPGHMRLPEGPGTVEDLLSGPGLARLKESDPDFRARFSRALGGITRDLVLATGAWGGVRFCGGVTGSWDELIDERLFRAAYDVAGPMAERLADVPLARIVHPYPALLGLLHARIG